MLQRLALPAVSTVLVSLFGLPVLAPPAHAEDTTGTPTEQAIASAVAQATQTGQSVTVDAVTDSHSLLTALPDGTLQGTISVAPERTRQGNTWVPLNATLHRNSDGSYSTTATPSTVTFSGGGAGTPLASVDNDGQQLAVSWPTALPTPNVTGDHALYPEVLPGVDLKVTASKYGGFSNVLIVKTAQAAQNPALTALTLGTSLSPGLTLNADAAGNMSVTDSSGQVDFHAAAPLMWDSSAASASSSGFSSSQTATAKAAPQARADASTEGDQNQDTSGRDPGDQVATIDVTVDSSGQVRLEPDRTLLTGEDTNFPVYIDPTWVSSTKTANHWAYVQQGLPSVINYDDPGDDLGVGYQGFSSPTGVERAYYQFSIPTAWGSTATINSGILQTTSDYAADFSCSNAYTVTELSVQHITSTISWNNQPAVGTATDTASVAGANHSAGCPDRTANFDVTGSIGADGDGIVTFRLTGSESNQNAFKRFSHVAKLTVQYNTPPDAPTALAVSPTPRNPDGQSCDNLDTVGWIGKTTTGIKFSGHAADDDGANQNVRAEVHIWNKGLTGEDTTPDIIGWGVAASYGNYVTGTGGTSTTGAIADSAFQDGHMYGWDMRGWDGINTSGPSVHCYFKRDLTSPALPTMSYSASTGKITMSATDPVPSGGTASNSSGIAKFYYSDDPTDLTTGSATATTANGTASASFAYQWPTWGTNYLYGTSVDKANNQAPGYFPLPVYVPQNPATQVHPGDVDGDTHPDLLYTTSAGLTLARVTGDVSNKVTAALPSEGPGGVSWNSTGMLLAHRSSLTRSATADFKDDLWVHAGAGAGLFLYRNGGKSPYFNKGTAVAIQHPDCPTEVCGANYNRDWSNVTQLIATGDITGDDIGDIITVETSPVPSGGSFLWLYPGSTISGMMAPAIQLGTRGDWNTRTIMAPSEAPTGTTQAMWARNSTGVLYTYPITENGDGTVTFPDTPTQIGSFSPSTYPKITSLGDTNGDGYSDIYVTTSAGELKAYQGTASTSTNRFDAGHVIQTTGWGTGIAAIG
ncbi:VCBS repeat-containing protein [Planotetraspora silvatica]